MLDTFFNLGIIAAAWPILLDGLLTTLWLSLVVVPLGALCGVVLAVLSTARHRWVRWPLIAWVDFFRAFPPLVLLIFLYAALPFAGIQLGGFGCVVIGFCLNTGAYYGEVLRAGIESVPAGQMEAARGTGLTRLQAMAYVVLPQAVRNVLPDLVSNTLEVVKLTSIASVVALPELLFQARQAQSVTYNPTPIVAAARGVFPAAVALGAAGEPAGKPRHRGAALMARAHRPLRYRGVPAPVRSSARGARARFHHKGTKPRNFPLILVPSWLPGASAFLRSGGLRSLRLAACP